MPWNNQNGDDKVGDNGPWTSRTQSNRSGPVPPEINDVLRNVQDRFKHFSGAPWRRQGILVLLLIGCLGWLFTGAYTVQTNELAINLIFGSYKGKTGPGLNYNFPYPIGSVIKLPVLDQNAIDVGSSLRTDNRRAAPILREVPEESLMLTGDENIADVKFRVIWQIDPANPEDYAFNIRRPQETIKAVAESAMREIVGRTPIQRILTAERKIIEPAAQKLMQNVLDHYEAGVRILQVQLLSVDPPEQVIAAFKDVTAAQQDLQRQRNEAEAYANKVVPEARGAAARILQEAEGYRTQTVEEAEGQAARFLKVYREYVKAPEITRKRLYLETMEIVFRQADKVILETGDKMGAIPVVSLNDLFKKSGQGGSK